MGLIGMKRFSYLLLAACFCLPLVGCGGEAAPPAAETPAAEAPAAEEGGEEEGSGTAEEGSGEKAAE